MITTEAQVWDALDQYFKISGDVQVLPDLTVNVQGTVSLRRGAFALPDHELPVQFGTVDNIYLDSARLKSCKGSPRIVTDSMWLHGNPIESLENAPEYVGKYLGLSRTKLKNLHNFPEHVGKVALDYSEHLPLLRSLTAHSIVWPNAQATPPVEVSDIMDKYAGQGKSGALNCALELKKAGYAENARW